MITVVVGIVTGLMVLGAAIPGEAGPPTQQLQRYTDQVVKVLEDPALRGDGHRADRREAVRRIAGEIFDVPETARRALGRHWQGRSPAEREEFVRLFGELLERTYIARIDQYGGERVRYVGETVEGDTATVRGKVVTRQGTEIPVDARMIRKGDRWLMYDVAVENISLIGNYRAQFDSIIRKSSFADLVQRMRDRQSDFVHEKPRAR
jgi:phospholipid transport system substrate-binding protein